MSYKNIFTFLLLSMWPLFGFSADTLDDYIQRAKSEQLYNQSTWKKLLVYETSRFGNLTKSAIHSARFFNSPDGMTDSEAELVSTLSAFAQPVVENPDLHAQCRFPARYQWLKEKLNFSERTIPIITCPEFKEWSQAGQVESISIVFATGFLGNPASYYGHTLLKLNTKDESRTRLLDISVNYGAIVPDNEDPVTYIIKGLLGGYDAGFSHTEYYFHNQSYGEIELRDLWEYELNLKQDDIYMILAHTWEVMGQEYTYYFLNKNCAYRMGELFEIIDGVKVNPDTRFWVIPQAQILQLGQSEYKGEPLIRQVHFQPSRQSRLYERFSALNQQQKDITRAAISDQAELNDKQFEQESLESKFQILDTMLDYYQFSEKSADDYSEKQQQAYRSVLSKRYQLPPGESEDLRKKPSPPHKGRSPSLTQIGVTNHKIRGNGLSVNIRPAYYDALDSGPEHIEYAELIMGQLSFESYSSSTVLTGLDIISIQSLNTHTTGLPGDDNASWRLRAGLRAADMNCRTECLVARLEGDKGLAWKTFDRVVLGAYIGGAIQDNRHGIGNFQGRITTNATAELSSSVRARMEYQHRRYLDSRYSVNDFQLDVRYKLAKNRDIRFAYKNADSVQYTLMLGYYW